VNFIHPMYPVKHPGSAPHAAKVLFRKNLKSSAECEFVRR
jgi:hypothetical protein